jgi:hypothetical protein
VQRRVRDVDAHAQQQTTDLGQLRVFELLLDERALLQTPRPGCPCGRPALGFSASRMPSRRLSVSAAIPSGPGAAPSR